MSDVSGMTPPTPPTRVVAVTGSRDWADEILLRAVLSVQGVTHLIVGDCGTGADAMAWQWASECGWNRKRYHAQWLTEGKKAGPLRNRRMLDEGNPHLLVAFKRGAFSKGTDDCISAARARSIDVVIVQEEAPGV